MPGEDSQQVDGSVSNTLNAPRSGFDLKTKNQLEDSILAKYKTQLLIGLMVVTLLIALYVLYTNPEMRNIKWKRMLCLPGCGCDKHKNKGRQVQFSSMSDQIANLRQ